MEHNPSLDALRAWVDACARAGADRGLVELGQHVLAVFDTMDLQPPTRPRQMSDEGLAMLQRLEGSEAEAYQDVAGHWTLGVGHRLSQSELTSGTIQCGGQAIRWREAPLTDAQMLALLADDVRVREALVTEVVTVPLTQGQFDCLVSFCYNVGAGAFRRSTLLRQLNSGDYTAVPAQLRRWTRAGGRTVQGLVNRREQEVVCWDTQV